MAVPKRGSRPIVVDEQRYFWYVRHRPTRERYKQLDLDDLTVAVELSGCNGSVLLLRLPIPHPSMWPGSVRIRPVLPAEVAGYIRDARCAGWDPAGEGGRFFLTPNPEEHRP